MAWETDRSEQETDGDGEQYHRPSMAELSMKYPVGSRAFGETVMGYRHTAKESALYLADGKWKPI
ncbi:MAG: hypothetical protein LBV33_03660 [Lachnospiraceae bacterium]|jgi:hypothetical protein|nr:hypothetical protein [Lachnospiraceae bacterium]